MKELFNQFDKYYNYDDSTLEGVIGGMYIKVWRNDDGRWILNYSLVGNTGKGIILQGGQIFNSLGFYPLNLVEYHKQFAEINNHKKRMLSMIGR